MNEEIEGHNHLPVAPCKPDCPGYGSAYQIDKTTNALVTVEYEFVTIQREADERLPIGWCNACVANAKNAQDQGLPADAIHAGVTTIAQIQKLKLPDQPMPVTVVIPLPSCLYHIGIDKSGSRRIQVADGPLPPRV